MAAAREHANGDLNVKEDGPVGRRPSKIGIEDVELSVATPEHGPQCREALRNIVNHTTLKTLLKKPHVCGLSVVSAIETLQQSDRTSVAETNRRRRAAGHVDLDLNSFRKRHAIGRV